MTTPDLATASTEPRSQQWRWLLCGILLTATLLNYANRTAYTQNVTHIRQQFSTGTDDQAYSRAEGMFGWGFAFGGLLFGVLADKISVRWLYPAVVVAWSIAGLSRGLVTDLMGLAVAHGLLGLFEAGHWPCALRTTQRTFKPAQRTMANSILQSGTSISTILTPLAIVAIYNWDPDRWRLIFFLAGGFGLPWAIMWLCTVAEDDVQRPVIQTSDSPTEGEQVLQEVPFWQIYISPRWWLLLFTVICINTPWHYVRVWLPDTLENDHGYSHEFVQYFTSLYYLATFAGSMLSGWLTARLPAWGWPVHRARMAAFLGCAILTAFSVPAAFLPAGQPLLICLLLVACGSLGLFPIYYSLNQELSAKHQGKVGGTLSFCTWSILAVMHPQIGKIVAENPEMRPYLFAAVGFGPLIAFAVLATCWGKRPRVRS